MADPLIEELHTRLAVALRPGSVAIDATIGNGHDTLRLAQRVGATGRVFGFGKQEAALLETSRRLEEAECLEQVQLFCAGHEQMGECLPPSLRGAIGAAVFNLGFLSRGEKEITTRPETTLAALDTAWEWLKEGGLVAVVAYPGHPGGETETESVRLWFREKHRVDGIIEDRRSEPESPEAPLLLLASKFSSGLIN